MSLSDIILAMEAALTQLIPSGVYKQIPPFDKTIEDAMVKAGFEASGGKAAPEVLRLYARSIYTHRFG